MLYPASCHPTRRLTYLVCFDPGGQSDRGARVYQAALGEIFGQKVIIDFKELGLDLMEAVDRGVAVPPDTPAPVIKKLEEAFLKVASLPEVRDEMTRQGFVPMAMGHEETKAYIARMTAIYKDLTASLGK
ncbi:MAG: hypothetical protein ACOZHQ_18690 [Thermodesulfobacteriota bacterium]